MRDVIKYYIKLSTRLILRIFWLFPIKKNNFFFMSNMGKNFSCNPKYIYMNLTNDKRFENVNFIWCFKDISKYKFLIKNKQTKVISKKNLLKYFYYLLTSKVVIYNCGGFSYAPLRSTQLIIETWHGGGAYKRVGISFDKKSNSSKKGIIMASRDINLFIGTSLINTHEFIRKSMNYTGKVLNCGYPRNDLFFHYSKNDLNNIKERLKIKPDLKIVLYAPTFKGSESNAINIDLDFEIINPNQVKRSLKERFKGDWLFLIRGHQYNDKIKIEGADLDVSQYEDMQELLLITDVLITDYSSCIWDFSLLKRPCFLFVPDLNRYKKEGRGFLTPIEKWPGILANNNKELINEIKDYDEDDFKYKIQDYLKSCKSYEKGRASSEIANYIIKNLATISSR